jgi:hypothetical protein
MGEVQVPADNIGAHKQNVPEITQNRFIGFMPKEIIEGFAYLKSSGLRQL